MNEPDVPEPSDHAFHTPSPRLSRRDLIRGPAAGGVLAGLAGVRIGADQGLLRAMASSQVEATPPAVPVPVQVQKFGPTIASKAADLDYDVDKIFRFVSDEVRYEAYAGALRGASGTLWGLAGNSVDKSLLLAALLDEALIPYRFARGALTPESKAHLLTVMRPDAAAIRGSHEMAVFAGYLETGASVAATPVTTPESTSELTPEETAFWQTLVDRSGHIQDLAAQRMAATRQMLAASLRDAGVTLPALPALTLPESESVRHVWVQIADGPAWKDLDATIAGADRGEIPGQAETSFDAVPDDEFHTVTIKIIAEEISGGNPVRRDAAVFTAKSADLATQTVTVSVTVPSALAGIGASLNQIFTGKATFVPYIAVSGTLVSMAQTPIVFGSDGPSLVGALDNGEKGGLAEGETVGLWYSVEIASPGSEPVVIEREIFDRIGISQRALGTIDLTKIAPVSMSTDESGNSIVPDLATVTLLSVDVSDIPSTYAYQRELATNEFGGMAVLGAACAELGGTLARQELLSKGIHRYLDVPNIMAFTMSSADPHSSESPMLISGDLVWRHEAIALADGAAPASGTLVPPVVSGALNQVAESVLLDPVFWGEPASRQVRSGITVQGVFDQARASGIPIRVLRDASDEIPSGISPEAHVRVEAALGARQIVVIPERPVKIIDQETIGWWTIDPQIGRTADMMENGRGYASATVHGTLANRSQVAEDVEITKEVVSWMPWWRRLGGCVGVVALLAAATIDPTSINSGTFTTAAGAARLAYRVYAGNPSVLKEIAGCL